MILQQYTLQHAAITHTHTHTTQYTDLREVVVDMILQQYTLQHAVITHTHTPHHTVH